ncbi:unnamed protein product [Gongylonema pulchrum]|uniref:Chitin-binding type-2 domain-containing protein n=1 Tax=Gongylonema pulchrum TaxID=637853 RepID=A0A183CYR4_9BILA|nr:unnamed protein product [Gongylonema pulchrum]
MNLRALLLVSIQIFFVDSVRKGPSPATILDCSRPNSNGLYVRGCSSKFMRCYNGKQYDYTCPKKLKFNVETAKCEQRRQVIACINNMDDNQVVVKADEPFDCSKKKDGVYGSGKCSTTYYHCSRGHSSEMLCPAGLYYNDKLKGCDDVDSVDECDVLTALRGKYIERNLRYGGGGGGGMLGGGGVFGGGTRIMSLNRAKGRGHRGGKNRRTRHAL